MQVETPVNIIELLGLQRVPKFIHDHSVMQPIEYSVTRFFPTKHV